MPTLARSGQQTLDLPIEAMTFHRWTRRESEKETEKQRNLALLACSIRNIEVKSRGDVECPKGVLARSSGNSARCSAGAAWPGSARAGSSSVSSTHKDEEAFEALMARHGPMVLGVCRRVLDDPCDVEDAFQATFLVLVKKAGSLRDSDLLANWLYGVAHRVAARAGRMPTGDGSASGRGARRWRCRANLARTARSFGPCSMTSWRGSRTGSGPPSSSATLKDCRKTRPRGGSGARWGRSRAASAAPVTVSAFD